MIFQRIFENIKQIQTHEGGHLKAEIRWKLLPEICEFLLLHLFLGWLIKFTGHEILLFHHMLYEELS